MSSYNGPRSSLPRPFEGYPAYGAVHDVLPNDNLREFLLSFSRISDKVFMDAELGSEIIIDGRLPEEIKDEPVAGADESDFDSRLYYKIFDVDTLGVSVLEMDPSSRHARSMRTVWEGHDFGAVEQEARNEINKKHADQPMRLKFNSVMGVGRRLPGVPRTEVRQKLALMPDPKNYTDTLFTIDGEADIIAEHIRKRLKQFVLPWDTIPHLTFAVFKGITEPKQIEKIIEDTNEKLEEQPVTIRLGRLDFRSKASRKKRK